MAAGRLQQNLVQFLCHPAAGQHPGHRKLPLPPAGRLERQLLSDAVAFPLFAQQKRLLIAPDIRNLIFDPFGPVLDLTYTTKNDVKETLKSRRPILLAGVFWTTAFLYRRFLRERNVVFIHKTQFFAACAASKPQNCFQSHAVMSCGPSRRAYPTKPSQNAFCGAGYVSCVQGDNPRAE